MDPAEIERVATEILAASDEAVSAAYLFGSVARGTANADSDVDVALLLRESPSGDLTDVRFRIEREIERALARTTQVVVLNTAPPDLIHRVLRDGHLLIDRAPGDRIRFEVRSRNIYFDLLPHLRRYRLQKAGAR